VDPETSQIEFICQHGAPECLGNKIQGCVLNSIRDQDTQLAYVACQMNHEADSGHRPCVEQFGFSFDDISECVASDFATQQQLGYEQITLPILNATNWVPSVTYNGKLTENSHIGQALPLLDVLCGLISNTNPACRAKRFFKK